MIVTLVHSMWLTSNKTKVVSYSKVFNSMTGFSNAIDTQGDKDTKDQSSTEKWL